MSSRSKTPIYFFSHGGPNIMFDTEHPAHQYFKVVGKEITTQVKPKAVVVISGHWQAGKDTVQVNSAELTDLIYDFYGFPDEYYKVKYPHVGNKALAQRIVGMIQAEGLNAEDVHRGPDHGVWVSFKCAFDPKENPLQVPIVQVSLFNDDDPVKHFKLGKAISKLREEGILIIVSGMAVHNLRDMRYAMYSDQPMPYTISFDNALKDAATASPEVREQAMIDLMKRPDARQAHPHFDHLLPIYVGVGAAGNDSAQRIFALPEGSTSWSQFRFGEIASSASL